MSLIKSMSLSVANVWTFPSTTVGAASPFFHLRSIPKANSWNIRFIRLDRNPLNFASRPTLIFLDPKGRKPSPREREALAWTARVDGSLREPHGIPNRPGSATSMWVSLRECLWIRRRRPGWLNGLVMPCPKLSQIGCLSEAGKMINRWSTHRTISEPNVLGSSLTVHWAFLNHIHICVYTYAHSMDTISTYIYIYACVHTHRHNSVGMELWVDPLQVRNFPARHAIQTRTASGSPKLLCPSNRCFSIPKIRKSLGFGFCSMVCFKITHLSE